MSDLDLDAYDDGFHPAVAVRNPYGEDGPTYVSHGYSGDFDGGQTSAFTASGSSLYHADVHCHRLSRSVFVEVYPIGELRKMWDHTARPCPHCTVAEEGDA